MDLIISPVVSLKAIGWQWYWEYVYQYEYEYDTLFLYRLAASRKSYDSYVNRDLPIGGLLLANADTPLVLPIDYQIRLLTTSGDVIHSLAVREITIVILEW